MIKIILLFSVAVISGCVSHVRSVKPAEVSTTGDAFSKALRGVLTSGLEIETKDRDAGIITTKWSDGTSSAGKIVSGNSVVRRHRFIITIDDGNVRIQPEVEVCGDTFGCSKTEGMSQTEVDNLNKIKNAL